MAVPVAVAGSDVTHAFSALPQSPIFDGSGSLCDPGRAIVGYTWAIMDKPAGSAAVLLNGTTATPTLSGADLWGNFRLFLVVVDDAADVSEGNPLLAPDSAFVHVRVTGDLSGLEKLADGERNYNPKRNAYAQEIEDLYADAAAQDIAVGHGTAATGAQLDTLVGGSSATGLHTHAAADVPTATTAAKGVMLLAEAPVDPANPRAVTQDYGETNLRANGTMLASGYAPGKVGAKDLTGGCAEPHAVKRFSKACTVETVYGTMSDGGLNGTPTVVKLYDCTEAQYIAGTVASAGTLVATLTFTPATNHTPASASSTGLTHALVAGRILAAVVDSAPTDVRDMGHELDITVTWKRAF